jgi:hypothetical protein
VEVGLAVSLAKDLVILGLTKMHGGVCTAGIDAAGTWIRPILPTTKPIGGLSTISDYCLLPIDFFQGGKSHLVNAGVSHVWLSTHMPARSHIEDWRLDLRHKPQLRRKLSEQEQAEFLARHSEPDLAALISDENRSLGLCLPESFSFSFAMNQSGTDISVRTVFAVGGRGYADVSCTDLRMRALGRSLLNKSSGIPYSLSQPDFERQGKHLTSLVLGLSRRFHGKHWLIVTGVHTVPELDVLIDWGRL